MVTVNRHIIIRKMKIAIILTTFEKNICDIDVKVEMLKVNKMNLFNVIFLFIHLHQQTTVKNAINKLLKISHKRFNNISSIYINSLLNLVDIRSEVIPLSNTTSFCDLLKLRMRLAFIRQAL